VRVSETFLSIQGEGLSAGTPAHFLRLQGCDVGCRWCDSKYTWDAGGGQAMTLEQAWASLESLGRAPLLVVTGGEPLTHPGIERVLAEGCGRWPRVEVETSGLEPPPLRHERLFWNVSPKLPSATARWSETWRHAEAWSAEPHATFKLVVSGAADAENAVRLIAVHRLPRERTLLMPEGLTDAAVRENAVAIAPVCVREGMRLGPRLHVWMWGARRGV
jgi:organic radical activating enzyme